jgi:hypothetical protein
VNGYVAAGYAVTLLGLGGYAAHVLRRARALRGRIGAAPAGPDGGR